jgi:hypothetical protein
MKKGVGSRVGSGYGSIFQRYGTGDPDPHQKVTDPQHCIADMLVSDAVHSCTHRWQIFSQFLLHPNQQRYRYGTYSHI